MARIHTKLTQHLEAGGAVAYRFDVAGSILGTDGLWHPISDMPPASERPLGENIGRVESRPCLYRVPIVKLTPCGYWVMDTYYDTQRWCSNKSRKRYAYLTIEEAKVNYEARTKRRISILTAMLERTLANKELFEDYTKSASDYELARKLKASLRPFDY